MESGVNQEEREYLAMTRLGLVDKPEWRNSVLVSIRKCNAPVLRGYNGSQTLDTGIVTG